MYHANKLGMLFLFLGVLTSANLAHAQVRGAGSKILGNYDRFEQRSYVRSTPTYPMQAAASEAPQANRAFSYERQAEPGPCDAAPARAPQATRQAVPAPQAVRQPTQAVRRYSYEPGFTAPARRYAPSRTWQSGVRDAGSKIRGDY